MTKKILTIAALALMMAACSNEDTVQQPAPAAADANTMPFRAVISADNTPTRGLTEATDHKSITAKWEVGEQIALIHGATIDVVEVLSVDAGVATLNGDITNYVANEAVYLVYVGTQSGAMEDFKTELLQTSSSSAAITVEMIKDYFNVMSQSQDGTLETIDKGLDFRLGTSTLTKTGNFVTLSTSPTLTSQSAIWKLTLQNGSGATVSALSTKQLVVKNVDGEVITEIQSGTAASEFYVLLPASIITGNTTYKFEATVGTSTYACSHSGINLTAGYFYRSTLTMRLPGVYQEWNPITSQFETKTATSYVDVQSANVDHTWVGNTYVVKGSKTIEGHVTITGDVKLILTDGAKLTVTGGLEGNNNNSLTIYSQSEGSGKGELEVTNNGYAIKDFKYLNIHGGKITATAQGTNGGAGIFSNESGNQINIYGGEVTAQGGDLSVDNNNNAGDGIAGSNLFITGNAVVKATGGNFTVTGDNTSGGGDGTDITYITISGNASLTATGGNSTTNGRGGFGLANNITINDNAYVKGQGGDGAGSGKYGGNGIGNVTYNGGQFEAYGGKNGDGTDGSASLSNITNGTVASITIQTTNESTWPTTPTTYSLSASQTVNIYYTAELKKRGIRKVN